ncbi:MAG: EAL domain-containing protein [Sulfurimonas sp.]|jgi:EAL domain-containing protein (putative c-di-GMP-specific phosphodiesterase class I)/FixJ family two-component response regulator
MHKKLSSVTKNISVLYVEDENDTREQYSNIFQLLYKEVKSVENGEAALTEYNLKRYDLVITDLTMPKMNGVDLISEILKINPSQHIVIMTAHNTSENLRNSIEFQVDGILLKPVVMDKLFQMLYKVSHLIEMDKKDDGDNEKDKKLTDLLENSDQALFLVVVDKFNEIIKRFGSETKKFITDSVKEHLSNFGIEDENIVELHNDVVICGVNKRYLDKTLEAVQAFSDHNNNLIIRFNDLKIYITLSYGVILIKESSSVTNLSEEFLLHVNSIVDNIRSDENSNLVVKMDVDMEEAQKNNALAWLGITLEALKQKTIVPFYQPIVDINSMKIFSYEVFARIKQDNKYILPEFFIDLSEKAGILEEISQNVFKQSFEILAPTEFPFHINVSDAEWRNSAMKDYLVYLCSQYKVQYNRVILDIVNYELLKPSSHVVKSLVILKELGFKIALKGFATSNINIELLSILQPEYIKINQVLLQKSLTDSNMKKFLSFILEYTKNENIKSILVGVETAEMLEEGKSLGIQYAQGYFIKEPLNVL